MSDDVPLNKICAKCFEEKPVALFGYHSQGKNNKRPICKLCHSKDQTARYKNYSPERNAQLKKESRSKELKRKFGIDQKEYDAILAVQGGKCGLCRKLPEHCSPIRNFAVDHCHDTGKVRGLLCTSCNMTLGRMGDNAESIRKVLSYIETPIEVKKSEATYLGLWNAFVSRVTDLSPDMPVYQRDLNRWLAELWEERPEAAAIFALRTTRYGRDDTD